MKSNAPEHWLKQKLQTPWHVREGVWTSPENKSKYYLIYLYLCLCDLPEAKTELNDCHKCFKKTFANKLIGWAAHEICLIKSSRHKRVLDLKEAPFYGDTKTVNRIKAIFKPWVKKWSLGSNEMLDIVVVLATIEHAVRPLFVMNNKPLSINGEPSVELFDFIEAYGFDTDIDHWRVLLSDSYNQTKKNTREASRTHLMGKGFSKIKEASLIRDAQCYIMCQILNYSRNDVMEILSIYGGRPSINEADFSNALKPFDEALNVKRKPGRPEKK